MRILAALILSLFLGLMFVSLFQMSFSMNMLHGMSGMNDCPFMADTEVLCAMNFNEHAGAWKSLFFTLIPTAFTLLLSLGVVVFVTSAPPHLLRKRLLHLILIHCHPLKRTIYTYMIRPYQELFSSGILHPKLF
jgi:ABC-type phosphate transport system permease subunit